MRLGPLFATLLLSCASPAREAPRDRGQWLGVEQPAVPAQSASAAPAPPPVPLEHCSSTEEGFDGWLVSYRRYAAEQGIAPATIAAALDGVFYDAEVVELDRDQKAFAVSFDEFFKKHVTAKRVARAKELKKELATVLDGIEAKFGVPGEVLIAIWGLETDFGENIGTRPSIRSLATLAYDCRRFALFRAELLSALRVIERGDLKPYDMVGAWAGEIGQTQFMPSSYERFAVDFDGDGRADLLRSSADALASTASYLVGHGWKAGEAYKAGSANYAVLAEWNASELEKKTIVAFAAKLGKKPKAR